MLGLMQDWPLLIHKIIDHAALQHGEREVVSRAMEGYIHRTNYSAVRQRALKIAKRLTQDGIVKGDRVATMAWNTWRHLRVVGMELPASETSFAPSIRAYFRSRSSDNQPRGRSRPVGRPHIRAAHQKRCQQIASIRASRHFDGFTHRPATSLRNAVNYEDWIGSINPDYRWQEFDENTAAGLCYTSGTTGDPKGVLYSHRSNVLTP